MITYEVKLVVQSDIEDEWLHWMRTVHVPDVIATGLLRSYQILKPKGTERVYLFQYHFENENDFRSYEQNNAEKLRQDVKDRYDGKFSGERTIYEWV